MRSIAANQNCRALCRVSATDKDGADYAGLLVRVFDHYGHGTRRLRSDKGLVEIRGVHEKVPTKEKVTALIDEILGKPDAINLSWSGSIMQTPSNTAELERLHAEIWARLNRATNDRRSQLRWVNLATIGLDGSPQVRTVILRRVLARQRALQFHTDRRSEKFAELTLDGRLALHFHDRKAGEQIRITGLGAVASNEQASQVWASIHRAGRETYLQAEAPGSLLINPFTSEETSKLAPDEGSAYFAVIEVAAIEIDCLKLGGSAHRRAKFKLAGPQLDAAWVNP